MMKWWGAYGTTAAPSNLSYDWPDANIAPTNASPSTVSTLTFVAGAVAQGTGTSGVGETNVFGTTYLQVRFRYDAIMMGQVFPSTS